MSGSLVTLGSTNATTGLLFAKGAHTAGLGKKEKKNYTVRRHNGSL